MKKQIAIIALRRSVPSELYQDVVAIVIKSDQDPDVRRVAIREAATFQSAPEVAAALAQIIQNPQRSSEERQIAQSTLGQLGLNSIAPEGAFTFFSALPAQQSLENSATGSSIFSFYLIELYPAARHHLAVNYLLMILLIILNNLYSKKVVVHRDLRGLMNWTIKFISMSGRQRLYILK